MVDVAKPEIMPMTNNTLQIIEAVNHHVNRSISPRRDLDHWGKIDQWDLPTDAEGDCEDYQLLKRKLLVEAGLPRRAMRMPVVIDETGQGHAVRDDSNGGRRSNPRQQGRRGAPVERGRYEFIKRESSHAVEWLFLERETTIAMVAMSQ